MKKIKVMLTELHKQGIVDEEIAINVRRSTNTIYRWRNGQSKPGYGDRLLIEKFYQDRIK